ncbi:hypothetical protein FJZ20_00235 [Candidatus Pacearchaeota archaeon]|nr:hypothetical protein [Candidatus Pacearchaeota archaeon]
MKKIFNIFSKKNIKEKEHTKITVDYREKNSLVISELSALNLQIEFASLEIADYIIGDVAIERKTVSDFISSMINRRLLNQLEKMSSYENRLLIIEGLDEQELYFEQENNKGVHANSIRGFLISILLKHKTPIIFTKNYEDTAKFLEIISRRKTKEMSLHVAKKNLNKSERLQFILEGFPGIGPKTAKELLKKFGTIRNIINAPEEELKQILGKRTENILRIIDQGVED